MLLRNYQSTLGKLDYTCDHSNQCNDKGNVKAAPRWLLVFFDYILEILIGGYKSLVHLINLFV